MVALAGESAAWHLGLLARRCAGPLRSGVLTAALSRRRCAARFICAARKRTGETGRVDPCRRWLRDRGLDLTRWSAGLPAFGPETLLVQLAVRPTTCVAWGDAAVNIGRLAEACDRPMLLGLLEGRSTPAHQMAASLLELGGRADLAAEVLQRVRLPRSRD